MDLKNVDPDVYQAIQNELARQRDNLELIASENIVSQAVLQAQGSVMTNTNIKVYSDFDLLAIVDRYHYAQTVNDPYTASDPDTDIQEMWKQGKTILSGIYDEVDASNPKCISVINKSLNRKVDVVFAF